jgi:acyl carrier protein
MNQEIFEKVKTMVVDNFGCEESKVVPEASFLDDLGGDSLDQVEFVMSLEEEFGIEVPDEAAEKIKTVGDAVEYIENNVK